LPTEVDFISASTTQGNCAQAEGTVTCGLGELSPDASATITLVVAPNTTGNVTNTATISANEDDPFPGNNSASTQTALGAPGCGQVITANTQLSEDLGPCPSNGVIIGKDAVTLDLGGHRIFGFDGPGDGNAAGIRLPARFRVRIQNGTVSGFDAGVVINGGGGNTVSGLEVRDNVGPDDPFNAELGDGIVLFDSQRNRIVDNVVVGNGIFDGIGVLGPDADGNLIQGNTVEGTIGPSDGGPAGQGIIINGASEADLATLISGTRILDNIVRDSGSGGIANINNTRARIERNVVEDNGLTNRNGNGIGVQIGLAGTGIASQVLIKDNQVHGNGLDGIQVRSAENRILNNNAAGNNILGRIAFDLRDLNANCDSNVWRGNIWGAALFSPICTTTGGSGPPPPPLVQEGPVGDPTCFDGFDNDGDGLVDVGQAPGCGAELPLDESFSLGGFGSFEVEPAAQSSAVLDSEVGELPRLFEPQHLPCHSRRSRRRIWGSLD
jgi:parallel beta-helix repeat protein